MLACEYRSSKNPDGKRWIDEDLVERGFKVVRTASGYNNGKELTRVAVVEKTVL